MGEPLPLSVTDTRQTEPRPAAADNLVGKELLAELNLPLSTKPQAKAEQKAPSYLGIAVDTVVSPFVSDAETRSEVQHYGTAFLKAAGLFMRGRLGLAGTLTTYALDQAKPTDSIGTQLTDAALGSGKGLAMRGMFHALGSTKLDFASKGMTLGVSSRILEAGLTRQTYMNQDGQFSFVDGMNRVKDTAFHPTALKADVITFGIAHGAFRGMNFASKGALDRSPMLSTMLTGTTFGASTGAYAEIMNQQANGTFDLSKIVKRALIQGGLDTIAAVPGGLQARAASLHLQEQQSWTPRTLANATGRLAGERPTLTEIRFAEPKEAARLWHQAAKTPGQDGYSLGTMIKGLPEQARLGAFERALTEFPSRSLMGVVESIPRAQAKELVTAITRGDKIDAATKADLLYQMRLERFSAKEISELMSTSGNHPSMMQAVRQWWQYQQAGTDGAPLRTELSRTLPPETLGQLVFGDKHAQVGQQLAITSPEVMRSIARSTDLLGSGPAVEQLAAVSKVWASTRDLSATTKAAVENAKYLNLSENAPTTLPEAVRAMAAEASPAQRRNALAELSKIVTSPYERQGEHGVAMAYKMAGAVGQAEPSAFRDAFIKAVETAGQQPGQTLEWRRFSAGRLAELQRSSGIEMTPPSMSGLEVRMQPLSGAERGAIAKTVDQLRTAPQTADVQVLATKMQEAVAQIEPTQRGSVPQRIAAGKQVVEQLAKDAQFKQLTPEQQADTVLAALLSRTVESRIASDGAAKSALAAEAVLRSMGLPPERATRISAIIARGQELAYSPTEPVSGKLAESGYREDLAVYFRNPATLQQAMLINRAQAIKQFGEGAAKAIDAELSSTSFLVGHEASLLNRNLVPVLSSELPQQFGVLEAPKGYVVQAHTSSGIADGSMLRLLPLMESPQYSISTTQLRRGFDKTFDERANVVGLFAAPPENTAQAYRGSLWSGSTSSWRDHVSMTREWVRDQSAVQFAGEINTALSAMGFGKGKQGPNPALRDYQERLMRYSTLDQMLAAEPVGSPLRRAHEHVSDAYTRMSTGERLPDYNEFKTINPRLTGIGIVRRGQQVTFEDATIAQKLAASSPSWLSQGAADAIVVPKTVTDQAQSRNLPIVILD